MIRQILYEIDTFKDIVAYLKSKAPVYPHIYFEDINGCKFATTMAQFKYKETYYVRHLIESIISTENSSYNDLCKSIKYWAEMCMEKAIPCLSDYEIISV